MADRRIRLDSAIQRKYAAPRADEYRTRGLSTNSAETVSCFPKQNRVAGAATRNELNQVSAHADLTAELPPSTCEYNVRGNSA